MITNTLIDIGNLKISKIVTGADADLTKRNLNLVVDTKEKRKIPFSGVFELDAKDGPKPEQLHLMRMELHRLH